MTACIVDLTRQALYQQWLAAEIPAQQTGTPEREPRAQTKRKALARAARLVTEITRGRATPAHLPALRALCVELRDQAPEAARILAETLERDGDVWRAHAEESRCVAGTCFVRPPAPCQVACPAHIDIPAFIAHVGGRRYAEAVRVITADNPLPYSCGLVCPAPCEDACLKGASGAPLFIRPLKAVAAERALAENGCYPLPERAPATGRKVGIVGSGPAGLTTAWYLAIAGHQVDIFEAEAEPGGMLRYGIPTCRLPQPIVDSEIANLRALGVSIHTRHRVTSVSRLKAQGFDAVFVALGLQHPQRIPVEGVNLPFVHCGVDFLRAVRDGDNPRVGPNVVVIGSGNVAMDVALSALRQGAARVELVCRAKREDMRASPHEIATALEEGVNINNGWRPVVISRDCEITFERYPRMPDELCGSVPAQTMTLKADSVLLAVGQSADLAAVGGCSIEVEQGLIAADPVTLATSEEGVFAGGDVVHGARTVIEAVRAGKQAAESINAYLDGEPVRSTWAVPQRRGRVAPLECGASARSHRLRPDMPRCSVAERIDGQRPIELGLTAVMAEDEASRCLRCDICIGCGLCELVCSEMGAEALRMVWTGGNRLAFADFERPDGLCLGCGACVQVCPTGAIRLEDRAEGRVTVITGTVVQRQMMRECPECSEAFAPQHLMERLNAAGIPGGTYCPECTRKKLASKWTHSAGAGTRG